MMTIDLESLFADAECPDYVLADALEESGIILEMPYGRELIARRARELFALKVDTVQRAVDLAHAELWAEREGVDYQWSDDHGHKDEHGEWAQFCVASHPLDDHPNDHVFRGGVIDDDSARIVQAELAEELRPLILDPHPLTDCCPYDLAKEYGLFYSGDISPIPHGGYWYSLAEWEKWGYAPIVEVREWRGDDEFLVSVGSVNRQEGERLDRAMRSVGCTKEEESDPHWQIDAIKGYWGADYDQEETFVVSSRRGMNALWEFIAEELDLIHANKKG